MLLVKTPVSFLETGAFMCCYWRIGQTLCMAEKKLPENKAFELVREIALPRHRVWHLLSHTDHLNRAIGLSAVQYQPPDSLSREASTRVAGQALRWREFPFEWVREKEYSVLRVYESGPVARFEGGIQLEDGVATAASTPATTRVRVWADLQPANAAAAFLIPVLARAFLDKTWNYCQNSVEEWQQSEAENNSFPGQQNTTLDLPRPVVSSPANVRHLQSLLEKLRIEIESEAGVQSEYSALDLIEKLGDFLRTRGDSEVAQIRPYQLAAAWRESRESVLGLCLHATRVGILNLSWNLMCPNCRVSKTETRTLSQVQQQVHCDLCGVSYDLNFDRYIELQFAVHPAVRVASAHFFCIGGPFLSPHVWVQRRVAPGASSILPMPENSGENSSAESSVESQLRVIGKNHICRLQNGSAEDETLIYENEGWAHSGVLRQSENLRIENRSDKDIWVTLEKIDWDHNAATAAHVTALPEFRRWFSSEVLAPGRQIAIENLTLFFSDLQGSTSLYERSGDAPAYGIVSRHFDFLSQKIEAQNGAMVKTIGDATMAVFQTPDAAVRASLEIQKEIERLNASLPEAERLILKIGLHHGAAIVVNSNDRLDYFGRVVNIAARLSAVGYGGDIVLSAHCYAALDASKILAEYSVEVESAYAQLKGIEGETEIYRVRYSDSVVGKI